MNWLRQKRRLLVLAVTFPLMLLAFNNCMGPGFAALGSASSSSTSSTSSTSTPTTTLDPSVASQSNVMAITVGCGYVNEPCVSVTICQPGTSNCQTINNVLLDTGSYGLRLFSSVVTLSLTNVTNTAGADYAECVSYADGSSQWGPVKTADVVMAQETASNVPIQIIDSTFGTVPTSCTNLDTSAAATGFNGILGVGLFVEDCGVGCTTVANNNIYYTCSGATCTSSVIPVANQVSNPVGYLSADNNGVVMQMASVADGGAVSSAGYLILGVNTRSDNQLASPKTFTANVEGEFTTVFNGQTYSQSFIDSGSNGLYFPTSSAVTACPTNGDFAGFYCPTSEISLSGTQMSADGTVSESVSFSVANASTELASTDPDYVFDNLGGAFTDGFDWGLPFFFGRTIAVGIQGRTSSLGTGPYWAY